MGNEDKFLDDLMKVMLEPIDPNEPNYSCFQWSEPEPTDGV